MQESRVYESELPRLLEMERAGKLAKVHHQHLGNGQVRVRQFYTGTRDADIHAQMDAERALIEAEGGRVTHRTSIGRNATCPCGSQRKFKRCCMPNARVVNRR